MLYLFLIFGLALLAFGGDTLIKGAVGVANKLKISPLVVGIILVGFGTSTPELIASILAVFQTPPVPGIAVGNVIGSNICNVLLVLGVTAVIRPIQIEMKDYKRDAFFLIFSTIVLGIATYFGALNRLGGVLFVAGLISYICICYLGERNNKKAIREMEKELSETADNKHSSLFWILVTIVGIIMTMYGAKLLVDSAVQLARQWGISETIIGLTVVAIGTSLPELASSIAASVKKHNEVAYGNIVGSNIYNALFILGVVALLKPFDFPDDAEQSYIILACVTLWLVCLGPFKRISRLTGLLFLLAYAGYILCLM